MARHKAGHHQAGDFVSRQIADLPDYVVPFMIPQHQHRLALLPKRRGELIHTIVGKSQLQLDDLPARALRIDPQREPIELTPVLAVELSSNTGTAPPAAVCRPRDIQPRGHAQTERLSAV